MGTVTPCHADDLPWGFQVQISYDAGLVQDIKRAIPSRARRWDADRRRWLFKSGELDGVLSLLDHHGGWCMAGDAELNAAYALLADSHRDE